MKLVDDFYKKISYLKKRFNEFFVGWFNLKKRLWLRFMRRTKLIRLIITHFVKKKAFNETIAYKDKRKHVSKK